MFLLVIAGAACAGEDQAGASPSATIPAAADSAAATPAPAPPAPPAPPRQAAKPGARTILFIGTSLTAGLGLPPEWAYPALIQRRLDSLGVNYQVINAGVSGQTSAGALRGVDWLMRQPPDIVVIEMGANDGLRALPVDSLRANVQGIIDKVRAAHPDATILLAAMEAPPNLGPSYTAAFRDVYPELAAMNDVTLIPFLLEGVAGVDSLNQSDGIHPNERGERIVAENVWRVLRNEIGKAAPATAQ